MIRRAARRVRTGLVFRSIAGGDHVTFLGRAKVYVNKNDARGRRLLDCWGPIYPWPALAWVEIARRLRPNLYLDIGANYGEIGLSTRYEAGAKIYLCEPNPQILPYLKRSIDTHHNATQISLVPAFISDKKGEMGFKSDVSWSGTSCGVADLGKEPDDERYRYLTVSATTIDALLSTLHNLNKCRLQFKVDVEGFEQRVLGGMKKVMSTVEAYAGILEFDSVMLERANTVPAHFFKELQSLGQVWELNGGRIRSATLENLRAHTDLILASANAFDSIALPSFVGLMYRLH